ncbi:helix-turn-helix domain-containing protein [Kocuria turfanensis]|uniref:helix-turn-helix domain-containing protein n=1 Tax=Kocuria turfanensis TaxID=388357 RepID=UPI00403733B8
MGSSEGWSVLTTRDPEEGRAALQQAYRRLRLPRPEVSGFELSLASTGYGPLTAQRLRLIGWDSSGANDSTGLLCIGHLAHGRFLVCSDRTEVTGGPAFLFPSGPYAAQWKDLGLHTLTIEAAVVEDYARALTGRTDFRLEFTGHHPLTDAHTRYWHATAGHVIDHVMAGHAAAASPLLLEHSLRDLATAVLQTFPNSFLEAGRNPDPPEQVHPAALRRAIAFIETHLAEPIGLPEIAAAARLSPRGLQSAFRRHLDTTPLRYLRTARIDAAHAELLAAGRAPGTTVTAVATRWGFAHPGRFAAAYRAQHGEAPGDTLRR